MADSLNPTTRTGDSVLAQTKGFMKTVAGRFKPKPRAIPARNSLMATEQSRRAFMGFFAAAPVALKGGVDALVDNLAQPANLMKDALGDVAKSIGDGSEGQSIDACCESEDKAPWIRGRTMLQNVLGRNYTLPNWKLRYLEINARRRAVYNGITPEISQLKSLNIHTKRAMQIRAYIKEEYREILEEQILDDERDTWYEKMRSKFADKFNFGRFL